MWFVCCWCLEHFLVSFMSYVISASSQDPTSPPSQRRRGQDSSTGDLMPMPTSPPTDMLSPAGPQDTSLFSSPRPSGTSRLYCILRKLIQKANLLFWLMQFCQMKWTWAPLWCTGPPAPGLKGPHAVEYVAHRPDSAPIWDQLGRLLKSIFILTRSVEEFILVCCVCIKT